MIIRNKAGFSLLEVVTVLVILSIVGVVVATRLMDTSVELIAQTDAIKAHLRYAQSRAMSSNVIWGIAFDGSTYSLFKNGDTTDTDFLPGEDSKTLPLPSGISISPAQVVAFDSWGKPYDNPSGTSAHSGGQIDVLPVVITRNTGFIE